MLGLTFSVGCAKLFHRQAPEAGVTATAEAGAEAEEDETLAAGDGGCPRPIHPDYCRRNCRTYQARERTDHARRVAGSKRFGFGTCGALKVFAEDETAGDGGLEAGIVEYFDPGGDLVGAVDTRVPSCGTFGRVPTSCTPAIDWRNRPSLAVRLDPIKTSNSNLSTTVIERLVRFNMGRFRMCAKGAATGRVVTTFVIGKDGTVTSSKDAGSSVSDPDVASCVVRAFGNLVFPEPSGGPVTVTTTVEFSM